MPTVISPDKTTKSPESTSHTKSTTRKRKSSLLDDKSQHEAKVSVETKVESKPSVISSPSSQSSKSQSIGSTKNKSSIENRPTITEESCEPSKLSPKKRETNERLKSPDAKLQLPVHQSQSQLEQEMNERKAEYQSTTPTSAGASKSKLNDALDKLFCKQKEKQQQQKQLQKAGKQSKRSSSHSVEENKSPIDMDIEPKESTDRDEIIDVVKENRNKYTGRNDVQSQSVTSDTDTTVKLNDTLNKTEPTTDDNINKYEQEQFVNNMPKPPTPKSSMIFSPPPTSLTIDKREASIFDFADNFPIPNDSSVSLLSFNSENLFKEDSAKETMDLVANLRQNIKKGGKGEENSRTKTEPSANQAPVTAESETTPDSTTIETSNKCAIDNNKSAKPLDSRTKAIMPQPTLVIDLDQENSGDESKPPKSDVPVTVNTPKSGHKDSNWMSNTIPIEKERANLMNMMQPSAPIQLQTEVEQIASKMSNVIPTPVDMLAETEAQNLNTFHIQQYPCNAYNGNKEAFDRQPIQIQVS